MTLQLYLNLKSLQQSKLGSSETMVMTVVGVKGQPPRTEASVRAQQSTVTASADGGAMLTPGIAHSPQSFLFIATNCKMHFPETGCVILLPLSSLFHL